MRPGTTRAYLALSALLALLSCARASLAQPIDFLPHYYLKALTIDGKPLALVDRKSKNGVERAVYLSADGGLLQATVELFGCETPACRAAFDNARAYLNKQATGGGGDFAAATDTALRAEWRSGLNRQHSFVFLLPQSVLFWSVAGASRAFDADTHFATVEALVHRHRYEQAAAEGNVAMGRWGKQIHEHARALLASGAEAEALRVLRELLATSPANYAAHLDFVRRTADAEAAKGSAMAVLAGAEDPDQVAAAVRLLRAPQPDLASTPALEKGETGLQLILIPLPPCDVAMLVEAARVYEQITHVPTRIRRLPADWSWGEPDRVQGQRNLQGVMINYRRANIDFGDWTKERFIEELSADAKRSDALSRYFIQDYIRKIEEGPGQFRVDPYIERLLDVVEGYRSADPRTMYVGVTEADIYGGDTNYLFSAYIPRGQWGASILSYSMMRAKTLGEPFQSRRRLTERVAKELVPASFKALRIPRPTDPTDPYSYSDGVERLAQKTLTLSSPTKQALDRLRQ